MAEGSSRVISGDPVTFSLVEKGLGEFLYEQAEKFADNVCQIDARTNNKGQTFALVHNKSMTLAKNLRKLGFTSEHLAVTFLSNTLYAILPHLAVLYLGAKIAALHPDQIGVDWIYCLRLIHPKLIFVDEQLLDKLEQCLKFVLKLRDVIIIVVGNSQEHHTIDVLSEYGDGHVSLNPYRIASCHDTAIIFFTPGIEDQPKAISHSHFSLINMTINYLEMDICNPSVILHSGTYFSLSTVLIMIRVFLSGGSMIVGNSTEPEEILRLIDKWKVTHCLLSPETMTNMALAENPKGYDTSSLHHYVTTGGTVNADMLLKLRVLYEPADFTNEYGTCEMGPITAFDTTRDTVCMNNLSSAGKCLNGFEIKILHEDTNEELGPNEEGEIWVKSPFCTRVLYNSPTVVASDDQGFIRTGDYGSYNTKCCLFVSGSCRENFYCGPRKVVPGNWERFLLRHPAIVDAAVIAVPDWEGYMDAGAIVVLRSNSSVRPIDICRYFTHTTPDRKVLAGGIKIVNKLPRTFASKLKRVELLKLFMGTSR